MRPPSTLWKQLPRNISARRLPTDRIVDFSPRPKRSAVVAGGGIVISHWPGHPGETRPRRAMILNMYTEKDYRRRGIARQLMLTMMDWLKKEGFPKVGLHASDEGRPLYESLGFEMSNEMRSSSS